MTRVVFYACPAFVGAVTSRYSCQVWIESSFSFNATNMVPVTLSHTPSTVATEDWVKLVDVDDHVNNGGMSALGPAFCEGAYSGPLYLSQRVWSNNRAKLQWPPYDGTQDFQYQLAVYAPGPGQPLLRYHGFLATIASVNANQVLVYVTEVGKSKPAGPFWVALDDPTSVDLPANGLTKLTPSSAVGTSGPLFLSTARAQQFALHAPKVPLGAGDEGIGA